MQVLSLYNIIKKLVSRNSSVIIGGNLTSEEEYIVVLTLKLYLLDIMYIAEPKYFGNYNNDENINNTQYKKQYKIYYDRMKDEEIDTNRKKHLTPIFEKSDNFFDDFEELKKAFNYSLMLENTSFKTYNFN